MTNPADTIVAAATPPGRGGIGIVRVSGRRAPEIARAILGSLPEPRVATRRRFLDGSGETIDDGIALYFPEPGSFTGEHVLELHGHGGPVVMDLLVQRVLALGARLANAGEFSQRAFLNDRLDLAQAEAIADLIDSGSAQAARAAMRSLQGEFSALVHGLAERIVALRTYVEAAIDFPEEEIDFLADPQVRQQVAALLEGFEDVRERARQGQLLRDGMTVVIAGAPNAGKSTLLNRLAGYEAAIVTPTPGTTRDVLRERLAIDGMPLHLLDTAGLRDSADEIEAEGVRRARQEMLRADRILFVVDSAADPQAQSFATERERLPAGVPVTIVLNKIDLLPRSADGGAVEPAAATSAPAEISSIHVSAATGAGIDALRSHLKECMGFVPPEAGGVSARRRHLDALSRAHQHVNQALSALEDRRAGELMAEELRLAHQALGEITGEFTSDDLLGRIFSTFCIGK
jgi:tRNA modification GTPase